LLQGIKIPSFGGRRSGWIRAYGGLYDTHPSHATRAGTHRAPPAPSARAPRTNSEPTDMSRATKDDIVTALSTIADPASGRDVIAAGLLQGLILRDGHVGFSIEVDPAKGAQMEPLRRACEEAVRKLPGILSVTAVLTAHRDQPAPSAAPRPAPSPVPGHGGHAHGPARKPAQHGPLQVPGVA